MLPKEHATLLVPDDSGVLEPLVPSMRALRQVREAVWDSLAPRTRVHTPLAGACEVVPLGTVHHGPTHRELLRARDGRLPSMQVMRRRRQKVTCRVIPALPRIICGGPEEDTGHLRKLCERDKGATRLLCAKVEEFTADLPLGDRAMEFMSSKKHGCKWTESLLEGVVPVELKQLFATVRVASSRGPANAKLFVEDMIHIGEDGYRRRIHRLTKIMQLPPGDRRKAKYTFLRGDVPFCLPAGSGSCRWNPYDGLPGGLQAAFQRAPLHALLVSSRALRTMRPCPRFPNG